MVMTDGRDRIYNDTNYPSRGRGLIGRMICLAGALAFVSTTAWSQTACNVAPTTIKHSPNYVPQQEQTYFLNPALYPHALCNDGTPGAYGLRPGFGLGTNRWVIYLHGGGGCVDQTSCSKRYHTSQTSSQFWRMKGVPFTVGIGSSDPTQNPDFYDANAVAIGYCSSDEWTGGTDGNQSYPPTDVRSWHFQGRAIALAVVTDLAAYHGLAAGQEVLFGGGSSGGLGVFNVANDLIRAVPAGIRVLNSADGGYAIDVQGFDPTAPGGVSPASPTPGESVIAAGSALWGGRGDLLCTEQATTLQDQQNCYSPQVLTHGGFLPPIFIQESEIDEEQASLDGLSRNAVGTPVGQEYLNGYFGPTMNQALSTVDPQHAVYSAYDGQHVKMTATVFTTESDTFPNGQTLSVAQAVGAWYRNPCPPTLLIQPLPGTSGQ